MNIYDDSNSAKQIYNKLRFAEEKTLNSPSHGEDSLFNRDVEQSRGDKRIYFNGQEALSVSAKDIWNYYLSPRKLSLEKRKEVQSFTKQLSKEYNFSSSLVEEVFFTAFLYSEDEKLSYEFAKRLEDDCKYVESQTGSQTGSARIRLFEGNFREIATSYPHLLKSILDPNGRNIYIRLLFSFLGLERMEQVESNSELSKAFLDPKYKEIFNEILSKNDEILDVICDLKNAQFLNVLFELKQNPELRDLYGSFMKIKHAGIISSMFSNENFDILKVLLNPKCKENIIEILSRSDSFLIINSFCKHPELLEIEAGTFKLMIEHPEVQYILNVLPNQKSLLLIFCEGHAFFKKLLQRLEKKLFSTFVERYESFLTEFLSQKVGLVVLDYIFSQKDPFFIIDSIMEQIKINRSAIIEPFQIPPHVLQLSESNASLSEYVDKLFTEGIHELDPDFESKFVRCIENKPLTVKHLKLAIIHNYQVMGRLILKKDPGIVYKFNYKDFPPLYPAIIFMDIDLIRRMLAGEQGPQYARQIWFTDIDFNFLLNSGDDGRQIFDCIVAACDKNKVTAEVPNEAPAYLESQLKDYYVKYLDRDIRNNESSTTPTIKTFEFAVQTFMQHFKLEKVYDIFKTHKLIDLFFANPIISAFLLRKELAHVKYKKEYAGPQYESAFENHIYDSMAKEAKMVIDARGPCIPISCSHAQTGPIIQKIIKQLNKKQQIDQLYSNIVIHYDENETFHETCLSMVGVGKKLKTIVQDLKQSDGLSYIIFRLNSHAHVFASMAIIDNKTKTIPAFLTMNSSCNSHYEGLQAGLLNDTLSKIAPELVPKVFINCNSPVQVNSNDTNCNLHSLILIRALIETLADLEVKELVELYASGKLSSEPFPPLTPLEQLFGYSNTPESQVAKAINEGVKKHLPEFYDVHTIPSTSRQSTETFYAIKPWEGPGGEKEAILKERWKVGRTLLKQQITKSTQVVRETYSNN